MVIDDTLLTKLEKLSAFTIPENTREDFKEQLGEFVNFAEILNELDLEGVQVAVSTVSGGTPFRADEPTKNSEVIDIILKHAPSSENGCFSVLKIIE